MAVRTGDGYNGQWYGTSGGLWMDDECGVFQKIDKYVRRKAEWRR